MLNPAKAILIIFMLLLIACKAEKEKANPAVIHTDEGLKARITLSAGEIMEEYGPASIPTFFNVASIAENTTVEMLVLGKRIRAKKSLLVTPIALFKFRQDSLPVRYLVSIPSNSNEEPVSTEYQTFMSLNHDLASAIESWFKAQCGLTHCSEFHWQDPHRTLMELEELNNFQE